MEYAYQNAWTASLIPFLVEFVCFTACWFCWVFFTSRASVGSESFFAKCYRWPRK